MQQEMLLKITPIQPRVSVEKKLPKFPCWSMLGSYNPLLIIVIICTVNVPQIKQTNKLKAQISPAVQTIG